MNGMKPLVTVLLCHNSLRHLVHLALDSYRNQDYEPRELVVVDDGPEPILDLMVGIPTCLYFYHPSKNLSAKRNFGVRAAKGQLIVHQDADDWSGPGRISDQVAMLGDSQVGGYGPAFWYDFVSKKASYYRGYIWGASMIYRRDYALANPWLEDCSVAEDQKFLRPAQMQKSVAQCDGGQNFVATMHDRNARRPAGATQMWPYVPLHDLPEGFRRAADLCVTPLVYGDHELQYCPNPRCAG